MDTLEPSLLVLQGMTSAHPTRRALKFARGQRFLKGPIPWAWLMRAAELPGRGLHTTIALWFLSGLTKSSTVRLGGRPLTELGVDRHSKYRSLRHLENAGLIRVTRMRGKNPTVTLLDIGGGI